MVQQLHKAGKLPDEAFANCMANQAEFVSYYLIATTGATDGLKDFLGHDWETNFSVEQQNLIKEALKIRQIMVYDNFCEFFRILRKAKTNYFFACLMINRMQEIRMTAMERLLKMSGPLKTDIEFIRSQLNLPNTRSAESFRDACGFYYEKDEKSGGREMLKRG